MTTENASLPAETTAAAGAQPSDANELQQAQADLSADEGRRPEGEAGKPEGEQSKKEKTQEEREIARLRRRVDNLTKRLYENQSRAQAPIAQHAIANDNTGTRDDNETLSLSRTELQQLIDQRAREVAPTITQQQNEIEHRRSVVTKLAQEFGDKFDSVAADLDEAVGGLADQKGQPKAVAAAIFESDSPRALIEYLTDPDNADEAEAIGRMGAVQAGRAIAKLEAKLAAKKAEAKPQPSRAPAPLEAIKGQGGGLNTKRLADMSDAEFEKRRRQQIANRR